MRRFARVLVAVTSLLSVLWESGGVSHAFVSPADVCVCPTRERSCGAETTNFGEGCVSLTPTLAEARKAIGHGAMFGRAALTTQTIVVAPARHCHSPCSFCSRRSLRSARQGATTPHTRPAKMRSDPARSVSDKRSKRTRGNPAEPLGPRHVASASAIGVKSLDPSRTEVVASEL